MWDAERLARFANAVGEDEIKSFRQKCDGFFPNAFWSDLDASSRSVTVREKPLLIPGFDEDVGVSEAPRCWAFQQGLRRAWVEGFPPDWAAILIALFHPKTSSKAWPYQLALMFLTIESWRARFCGVCSRCFVADKPARRFCSIRCSTRGRRASRMAWWRKEGNQRRKEAKKVIDQEKISNKK